MMIIRITHVDMFCSTYKCWNVQGSSSLIFMVESITLTPNSYKLHVLQGDRTGLMHVHSLCVVIAEILHLNTICFTGNVLHLPQWKTLSRAIIIFLGTLAGSHDNVCTHQCWKMFLCDCPCIGISLLKYLSGRYDICSILSGIDKNVCAYIRSNLCGRLSLFS